MENKLTDKSRMPFGKHQGVAMANVPADYLLWLLANNKTTPPVRKYILENKEFLEGEIKK